MTIYLIIPPDKIHSHRSLLKLWVGTLFNAILRRKHRPQLRTLFLLDEVASLETFPLLESLVTLSAGYGVWAWMIFQDLAQLQTHYKSGWKTILNNCGMIQTFGVYNRDMATQWSGYLDHGPNDLRGLRADEQVVAVHGQGEQRGRRLNYLTDSRFYSMFDENRFYTPEPTKKKRAKRAGEEPTLGGA
jgi:type IV secretion system protein VirD4